MYVCKVAVLALPYLLKSGMHIVWFDLQHRPRDLRFRAEHVLHIIPPLRRIQDLDIELIHLRHIRPVNPQIAQ